MINISSSFLRAFALLMLLALHSPAATLTWLGGEGDWADPRKWDGGTVPGPNDVAVINSGTVTVDWDSTISGMTLTGGTLIGFGPIQITGAFVWTGGVMAGNATTTVEAGATATLSGAADKELGRPFNNHGDLLWDAGNWLFRGGTFTNSGRTTIAHQARLDGSFQQTTAGSLRIPPNRKLTITGSATLRGALQIDTAQTSAPAMGDTFSVLDFASRVGTFDSISGLNLANGLFLEPTFSATNLTLTVKQKPIPVFTSSELSRAGAARFILSNVAGQTLIIEARHTLDPTAPWSPVLTNANSTIAFDFVETNPRIDPAKFFRVRLTP